MRVATLRRHQSGQWMVKINGKHHYLGADKSKAEYRYRELIVEHYGLSATTVSSVPSQTTIKDLLTQYSAAVIKATPPQWKKKRTESYIQVTRHAIEMYGDLLAEDFGPKAFKAVRQNMAMAIPKGKKERRRYSYVNTLCMRLRAAWKWGVSEEMVSESSYRRLQTVACLQPGDMGLIEAKEVDPVSKELYEATLPYLSDAMGDLVRLLWVTGARPSEMLGLTVNELHKDGEYWVYRPKNHKTKKKNKMRAIVFGPEGTAILEKYWPSAAGAGVDGSDARFFPWFGDASVIRKAVYRACDRAKLTRWHPYQLRHAAVTRISIEHGKEVAQAVAGHASVVTTNRYDAGAVEKAKRAAG